MICVSASSLAQGTLKGKITDSNTGEELIGATVQIVGTTQGAVSDLDGYYTITGIPTGNVKFVASYMGYLRDTIQATINNNDVTVHDFVMVGENYTDLLGDDAVVVTARRDYSGEMAMMHARKSSAKMTDNLSQEQMKKGGDGNAAGVMKRITGISVEGGKYVYVRGLSDRYSKTTLNGAEIPGLDPERNSVQMDLFPSNLLNNIIVYKNFTPDLPGSFTGGLVNIETRDYPNELTFQYSSKVAYNTQASLNKDFLTYSGSSTDWLGFDNGTRAVPDYVQENGVPFRSQSDDDGALTKATQSFSKIFSPITKNGGLNHSHSISFGNVKTLGERQLGYNLGMTYSNANSFYQNGESNRFSLTGDYNQSKILNTEDFLVDERSESSILIGLLGNLTFKLNPNNKFSINVLKNQNGLSSTRVLDGTIPKDDEGLYQKQSILQYKERSSLSNQLKGEHFASSIGLKVDWIASYTIASQETPDFRIFTSDYTLDEEGNPTRHRISPNLYPSPTRYYRDMKDKSLDGKINFELPLRSPSNEISRKIKFGLSNTNTQRSFNEQWYVFEDFFDLGFNEDIAFNGDINEYYTDDNMNASSSAYIYAVDAADERNSYTGRQNIFAGFLMTDYNVSSRLRLIAGARYEQTDFETRSKDTSQAIGTLNDGDLLPSVGVVYTLNEKQKLRGSYSKTLARPTFREKAPFASFSMMQRATVIGNPDLKRTLVNNLDLRWELYPNLGELISVGVFYKDFQNPIEVAINPVAANLEFTWKNQARATVYGAEIEARKSLGFIHENLDVLSAGFNVTFVKSETMIDTAELSLISATNPDHSETRTMFGQSPYIANAFLYYKDDSLGLSANVSFNVSGPKLAIVQKGGTPDVYTNPTPNLDFNISKTINDRIAVRFDARNLLNPQRLNYYNYKGRTDFVFNSNYSGRTYALSFSYRL